jgi:hypothetical protein
MPVRLGTILALAALVVLGMSMASAQVGQMQQRIPRDGAAVLTLSASGNLHLVARDNQKTIHFRVIDNGPRLPPMRVSSSHSGSQMSITISGPSQSILPFVGASGYELYVSYPAEMKVRVREFAGRVRVDSVTAPMQIYDENGNVEVARAPSPVTIEADNGSIDVARALNSVDLNVGTGNASATLERGWHGHLIRMEASNGSLRLAVPSGFRAHYDVTSGSGAVSNPFRSVPHAPLVFMLTENGAIAVTQAR